MYGKYSVFFMDRVNSKELSITIKINTPKLQFTESRFSEILGLVNKSQLP